MLQDQIRAILERRRQAIRSRDAAVLANDFADDGVLESLSAGTVAGRAAVEAAARAWFDAFPDVRFVEREEPLILGDRAVQFVTIEGTDTGGFLGQAATGRPFRLFLVMVFAFRDGQIVHERRVYDFNALLLQLSGESNAIGSQQYRSTLERALLSHDIAIAAKIQQSLLPPAEYARRGFEIATASTPCRAIGGDFVDYFDLPSGFGFALGDVSGKGPPAALLAGVLQGILAGHAPSGATPAQTLSHANQVLFGRAVEGRFATLAYCTLSLDGQLTHCNAGHNPPMLMTRRGHRRLRAGGTILGVFPDATFDQETIQLDPGDVVVAFSDGITEAASDSGEEFGDARLLSCLESHADLRPPDLVRFVLDCVHDFSGGAPPHDDLTALVLRYTGPGAGYSSDTSR